MAGRKFALAFVAVVLGLSTASADKHDRPGFGYSGTGTAHSHYQSCHDAQGHLIKGATCGMKKETKSK
jgi:hypothetical protein